jgi:hypothetical protein
MAHACDEVRVTRLQRCLFDPITLPVNIKKFSIITSLPAILSGKKQFCLSERFLAIQPHNIIM